MSQRSAVPRYGFHEGVRAGIPIALGYFAVSFSFGIQAVLYGLTIFESVLFSLTNVTSAGQFAGLAIIASNSSYFEMALTQFVINLRYMLMSTALSQKFDPKTPNRSRLAAAFGITDEIFGVAATAKGRIQPSYMYGMMAVAIPGWTLGTLCGAVMGNVLPGMVLSALGIALYGMFIAIFIPPCRKEKSVLVVVLCAMALGALFYYVPALSRISSGFRIILITVGVSAAAAVIAPVKEEEAE